MKKTKFLIVIAFMLILFTSPVFANISGLDTTLFGSNDKNPIQKILNIIKIISVVFLVIFIFWSAIKYLKADGGQKAEILKSTLIGIIVAATLILIAFKVPKWLNLDGVDESGAVIKIERTVTEENTNAENLL